MKEFLMIFRNEFKPDFTPTPDQMQTSIKAWQDWIGGIAAQGKFGGTNRLSSQGAKVMRSNQVVTDGPYVELKEIVGGYLIVSADNFDQALKMVEGCPIFSIGGNVEVREVIPMSM